MPSKESLRSRLIGAWELIEYTTIVTGESETSYPMGPDAKGMFIYNPYTYMSTNLLRTGQGQFERGGRSDSDKDWTQAGRSYIAYVGKFYLDEKGQEPILLHSIEVANLPSILGAQQRRLITITKKGRVVFNLAPDSPALAKMGCVTMRVRWRRLP